MYKGAELFQLLVCVGSGSAFFHHYTRSNPQLGMRSELVPVPVPDPTPDPTPFFSGKDAK
jgi:hypothetical protein